MGKTTPDQEFGFDFFFFPPLADVRDPGEKLQPGDAVVPAGSGPPTEEPEVQDGGRERRQSAGADDDDEREDLHLSTHQGTQWDHLNVTLQDCDDH